MKVAVVTDLLRANGASIMAATQARLLHDAQHEVRLISAASHDPDIGTIVRGLELRHFMLDDHPLDVLSGDDRSELSVAIENWLMRELDEMVPDVVVCHNIGRVLDQRGVAHLSRLHPTAVMLHDEWFLTDAHYVEYGDGELELSYEPHRPKAAREHDFDAIWALPHEHGRLAFIAPSRWLQTRCRTVYPTLPCFRVPLPIDPDLFAPVERTTARASLGVVEGVHLIGFVGHPPATRKGFDRLAEAVEKMGDDVVIVVMGGSQPAVPTRLRRHLTDRGLLAERAGGATEASVGNPTAAVLGPVARPQFSAVLSAMDVLVHPSRMDNLPTVPIEAQYCGVPCLVSDVGGSAETVVDQDAIFAAGVSPDVLAKRIRTRLAQAAHETHDDRLARRQRALDRFAPDVHQRSLLPLLEALAGGS